MRKTELREVAECCLAIISMAAFLAAFAFVALAIDSWLRGGM